MRKILVIIIMILLSFEVRATNYYFSAAGNDGSLTGSIVAPWKTLAKLSSVFASRVPGDSLLLNRGEVFFGQITIGRAGTFAAPITIGAYGTGAKPVVSGYMDVIPWTNLGGNIWESTFSVSTLPTCNMVAINDVSVAMGRTPNYPNYYTWQNRTTTSITSTDVAGANYTGSELSIFTATYIQNRHPITGQTGNTLNFTTSGDLWQPTAVGYFLQQFHIQNSPATLDVQNEWYYNPTNGKMRMYSTSMPTNVKVAIVGSLVTWTSFKDYVHIDNIVFEGSNENCMNVDGVKWTRIENCDFKLIGGNAIHGASFGGARTFVTNIVNNNTFHYINNMAIDVTEGYVITNSSFIHIGMLIGMQSPPTAARTTPNKTGIAVSVKDDSSIVSGNTFDSIGLVAIYHFAENTRIYNNFINRACTGNGYRDDGAIYTWNGGASPRTFTDNKIYNNIILNTGSFSSAIYFDFQSNGYEAYNNGISRAQRGIWCGQATKNISMYNNNIFDAADGEGSITVDTHTGNNSGFSILNNILTAKTAASFSLWTITDNATRVMPAPFICDGNVYARPMSINTPIQSYLYGATPTNQSYTLASFRTLNGQDATSTISPISISNVADMRFEYNETDINKTISLPFDYIDPRNNHYNGTVTLLPHTSVTLIKFGPVTGIIPPSFNHINHNNIIH